MSEATLQGLLDYLYSTLSPDNMRWMARNLMAHADSDEENLKPYTMEELNTMLDEAEADIAAGRTTPHEKVMREWEEELVREEQEEHQMAEAI